MKDPHFQIIYEGGLRNTATHIHSGNQIHTDAPLDNQGKGEAFSPTDLLCVALATCMMTTMGIKAKDKNIVLDNTQVSVQKIMKKDPRRVGGINIDFVFDKMLNLSDKDKEILERSADTCPVKHSIHPDIELNINFIW